MYQGSIVQIKRWIPRIVAVGLVVAGIAVLWIKKPWAKGEAPLTYTTVTVGRGPISAQVTAAGTLSARSTVTVGAQVSGRVLELHADFNDQVTKGQIIAKLDEQVLKAQIEQAQASYDLAVANLKRAQVTLKDAERQLNRQKTLQDQQLIAGATLESAEVAYETAVANVAASRAQVNQAAATLKQARTNLTYATIYSPVDGVVLERKVELGQTVAASLQAPELFTIAEDLSRMQINTQVAESDIGRIEEGMKATFTVDAFPGRNFEGTVRQVRNAATTVSGVVTYDAVIDVDNTDKVLRPGMTANVTFVLAQVDNAIKIPNAALRFKPSREQAMAMRQAAGAPGRGSGGRGSGAPGGMGGMGGPGGAGGPPPGMRIGPDGRPDFGDKKMLWKLVDGVPKMVLVKPGLTDGSATELLEGDLAPGDLLITEIKGGPKAAPRRVGAF
jgi:HlyD family secretion protein